MDAKTDIELYRMVYLIRECENEIIREYSNDEMKTPMHMSSGSEAIVSGVCAALALDDQVFGTYRTHALYLAKTNDPVSFFCELYGKVSGVGRGKAGSMHLSDPSRGHMVSSAIVASTIPVAVGNAFANKRNDNGKITVSFFGDGAINEGNFWESLNLACLWKLPIIFVCEDNELAVHTNKSQRDGYDDIKCIVENFNCTVLYSESTDASVILDLTREAIAILPQCPVFMHLKYYRYLEHVGVNEDFDAGYRSKSECEDWKKRDPLIVLKNRLSKQDVETVEREVNFIVASSIVAAKCDPFADLNEIYNYVYIER